MKLVVIGAKGRLGSLVVAAAEAARIPVTGVGRGNDLGAALLDASAVVDVSTAGSTPKHVALCAEKRVPIVVATTGLGAADEDAIAAASSAVPLIVAANLSVGAHLVALLAAQAARALPEADAEIVEVHHKKKKDAPSGTALMLARSVADARGGGRFVRSRDGDAPRQPGDIGVVAVRGGDVVGEHTVSFFLDGERVELAHKVSDRSIFARGALTAARFLVGKPPKRYAMTDVLQSVLAT